MAEKTDQFRKGSQRTRQAARKSGLLGPAGKEMPSKVQLPSSEFEETDLT